MAMRIVARNGQGVASSKEEAPVDVPALVEANRKALEALNEADGRVQRASRIADACWMGVRALLRGADSGSMRSAILRLVEQLNIEVNDAANTINCSAEDFGVPFVDEPERLEFRLHCAAARGEAAHG